MRIFLFALLIMLMPTVTEAENLAKADNSYGGTLVWGTRNKPTIINPVFTTTSVSMSLIDLIFNRLVRLNSKGEIEPDLAESWDISSDGLVYTFYLRKNVRFHDGIECTANDVKFTYDKIIDPQVNSPFRPYFTLIKEIKIIDKYTLQMVLTHPSTFLLYRSTREIIPEHLLENADLKNCSFNFHPVGTGPFRFKEWTKDNQIILEYNPDYYEGRPYLDKVMVKIYPNSRDLWIGLMRSEVDYATFIERDDYEVLKDDPSFKTFAIPWDNYYAISYDLDDSLLSDKRIREAIAYGIDKKALIEKIAFGYGIECTGPFYPGSLGFNALVKPFEYDPKKAQKLLAEAGFKDINNDGILEKNKEELELKILIDSRSEIYKRIIMAVRQQLQEIGIKVKVVLYDNEGMLTKEFLEQNKPQAYLRLSMAMVNGTECLVIEDWHSKDSKRANKLWVYKNEDLDKLFESGEITQDTKERQILYQKIHKLIYEDQPACFLYFPFVFHVVSTRFENIDEYFTLSMPTYTMKDWHIKGKARKNFLNERR